jgi:hypothetical protein
MTGLPQGLMQMIDGEITSADVTTVLQRLYADTLRDTYLSSTGITWAEQTLLFSLYPLESQDIWN